MTYKVRTTLDAWLLVDAPDETAARAKVERITDEAQVDIDSLHAIGEISEVELVEE